MTGEVQVLLEREGLKTRQPEEVVIEVVKLWLKGIYTLRGVAKHLQTIDGRIERQNIKLDPRTIKMILRINNLLDED